MNNSYQFGDINVLGTDDPVATADAVMTELRKRSLASFGTTSKWSDLP